MEESEEERTLRLQKLRLEIQAAETRLEAERVNLAGAEQRLSNARAERTKIAAGLGVTLLGAAIGIGTS